MKTIRLILFLIALVGIFSATHAAETVRFQGLLISASNDKGRTDGRLASYEPTLKSILRFESYHFLGEDSTSLTVRESGHLSIGEEHQLEVTAESADAKAIHVRVRWTQGGRNLISSVLVLRPGVPAVLGGPSTGKKGEVYAVILIGK